MFPVRIANRLCLKRVGKVTRPRHQIVKEAHFNYHLQELLSKAKENFRTQFSVRTFLSSVLWRQYSAFVLPVPVKEPGNQASKWQKLQKSFFLSLSLLLSHSIMNNTNQWLTLAQFY